MTFKAIVVAVGAVTLVALTGFVVGSSLGYRSGYLDGTCSTWDSFLRGMEIPQTPGNYPVQCPQASVDA